MMECNYCYWDISDIGHSYEKYNLIAWLMNVLHSDRSITEDTEENIE